MENPQTYIHLQMNTAKKTPDKRDDSNMATLIITVQQNMIYLQTMDTEEDMFALIMQSVYELVMQNKGHNPPNLITQHSQHSRPCLVLLPLMEEATVQLTSKLNLITCPHRAPLPRPHGLTKRDGHNTTNEPVPVPVMTSLTKILFLECIS
jgi:hypothetical protein